MGYGKGEFGFENGDKDGIVLSFDFAFFVRKIGFLGSVCVQSQANAVQLPLPKLNCKKKKSPNNERRLECNHCI